MVVREVYPKSTLSRSKVFDYVVNPYVGCQHGCTYCYARFMKRFTNHTEPWGEFVDIKVNGPNALERQINKMSPGRVWISGVCDPYQPLEEIYELTRRCLEILVRHGWPITIQTKSPLVLRDLDLFRESHGVKVGLSITTADDKVRRLFEPNAPPINQRIKALKELHVAGIETYAMIAPMLPGAEDLAALLHEMVDSVLVDRMNYHYGDWVYRKHNLKDAMSGDFFASKGEKLASDFARQNTECQALF